MLNTLKNTELNGHGTLVVKNHNQVRYNRNLTLPHGRKGILKGEIYSSLDLEKSFSHGFGKASWKRWRLN